MCLAIPVRVVQLLDEQTAVVDLAGIRKEISLALVDGVQEGDYVILHELMHLKQPNHSRQFWREVAAVCEGWRAAEQWLRTHGRELL